MTSIAAQFSVEKSQVSYTVVYLGRFSAMAVKWCVFPSQLEELVRGIFTLGGVGRGWEGGARKSEHGLPRSVGVLGRLLSATALCHTCSSVVHVCAGGLLRVSTGGW